MNQSLYKLARPYAQAIFEVANEKNLLPRWENYLHTLCQITADNAIQRILKNPNTTAEIRAGLINKILIDQKFDDKELHNFILLLAERHRLPILPQIFLLFKKLKEEKEQTVLAKIISPLALTEEEEKKLKQRLENRINKKIILENEIDPKVLGGFKIKMGDHVMDFSLLGELERMKQNLLREEI